MELRPDASHKENVPPRPAAPPRPEQRRFLRSPGVSLGSGCVHWVPVCQAKQGGLATTPFPGAVLRQKPCQVQTNLASPCPRLGLALKDMTGRLVNSSYQQQNNLLPLTRRPQEKAQEFPVQQSNLNIRKTTGPHLWPEPHRLSKGSPLPHRPLARPSPSLRQSCLPAMDTPCMDFSPPAGLAPLHGPTQPGPRSWCGVGSRTFRLVGEPLTLEDLAVSAQSQAQSPFHVAIHQLLASVRLLEHEAARLRCRASPEPPGAVWREAWTSSGQALPARPQPSQPVLASWGERKGHSRGHRAPVDFLETQGVQAGLSDSQAHSKPVLLETTLGTLAGDFLDSEQRVLPVHPLGPTYGREQRGYPILPQGVSSREARLCSSALFSVARGVLPGQEGGHGSPREQASSEEERTASCSPDAAPARSAPQNKAQNIQALEPKAARRQLLCRYVRAWRHLVWRRQAVAAAVALGRRHLLRKGLRALRWALWLREAQLEAAWGRHTKALLAWSFQEWRNVFLQQKRGQPHIQAGSGRPPTRGGQGQAPSLGKKAVVDPTWRSSPGRPREEEGAWRQIPLHPGQRSDDGDERVQILQALQQLAVFLLRCHQKSQKARQDTGVLGEATQRTRRTRKCPQAWCCHAADAACVAPRHPQPQRVWLCRCFGAWQWFVQRGTRYRDHLADRRVGILRTCLRQWLQMKQLRASDGAKVTQLTLCWQKAGYTALCSSAPGATTVPQAQGLPQEQSQGSLQEACWRLALCRVLLLWRTRLSHSQRANSFFQGLQQRTLQHILRQWRLRVWGPDTSSGSAKTTLVLGPLGSIPGGEASLGCSTPQGSLEKAPRAPGLLETLWVSFLWAAVRQQQGQCLLLWRARARQSRDAARWCQRTLQRRVLLSWSHWVVAQEARRELAVRWAWDRSCRAALGLWWRRLVQWREAEQRAQEHSQGLARDALHCWHSHWQRQQFLHGKYQRWVQVHQQGLRRAAFRGWQQAVARRRHTVACPEHLLLQSYFWAWHEIVHDTGVLWAQRLALQDGQRRWALGAAPAMGQEARVAADQMGTARHLGLHCPLEKLCAVGPGRQAVREGPGPAGLHGMASGTGPALQGQAAGGREVRAQGPCAGLCGCMSPTLARVLEAWAQSVTQDCVQQAAATQLWQAGLRRLLQTHWAQWRTVLLRVRLELRAEAQEARTVHPRPPADFRRWPMLASRGRLLLLMDAPAPWKQTHSCWTPATGPVLPKPTQQHRLGGQRKLRELSWTQSNGERPPLAPSLSRWMRPSRPPTGPRGHCSSETGALKGQREAQKRRLGRKYLHRWHLGALLHRLQSSQQARRLAATWQRWVDAQGVQQLVWTLLRQWHLRWAWQTWRRRVLQLWVAQRFQQQEDSWVLIQAFEKWHQRLAAKGPRTGTTSSPRPLGMPGTRGPGSRLDATQAPGSGGLGAEQGLNCSCDSFP